MDLKFARQMSHSLRDPSKSLVILYHVFWSTWGKLGSRKVLKEWFSPLWIWFSVISLYVVLLCITNIQHRNTPNLLFVNPCFKAFHTEKNKNICFLYFCVFSVFFWYFFASLASRFHVFHFFGKPYSALKNGIKNITFTKNMLKMITI